MNPDCCTQANWKSVLIVLTFSLLIASCDMGSYNPIARSLDPFEPLGAKSTAWMDVSGTMADPNRYVRILILQEGSPVNGDQGGYVHIEVRDQSTPSLKTDITLTRGIYRIESGLQIVFQPSVDYNGSYKQTSSPANNPDPIDRQGEIIPPQNYSEAGVVLTIGGLNYISILGTGGILDTIYAMNTPVGGAGGGTAQERAEELLMMYEIGIYASQVIIPGFGGAGMMTYYNKQTPFKGLVKGRETVLMSKLLPLARVDFDYANMVNIPGISMTGLLRTDSNSGGDGSLSETVSSLVDDKTNPEYAITIAYDNIDIAGTVPSSGYYTVTVDGVPFTVSFNLMKPGNLDYSRIPAP